jgi:outer membrane autotransporter protein
MTGGASVGPMAMNVTGSSSLEMRQLAAATGSAVIASDAGPGLASGSPEDRGGLWVQGFGGRQQLDGEGGFADVDSTNFGIAGGAELRRGSLVAGIAGGYGSIESEVDAFNARSDGDIYNAALYVGYDDGRTYASAQGGYFSGQLDISRQIVLGGNPAITASGEAEFEGYSLGAMVGQRFELGNRTRLALQVGALHTQVDRDGFTETGAGGLSLSVAEETRDLLTISGDARLSHGVRLGRTAVEPYLQLGVRFNSGDLESVSDVRCFPRWARIRGRVRSARASASLSDRCGRPCRGHDRFRTGGVGCFRQRRGRRRADAARASY